MVRSPYKDTTPAEWKVIGCACFSIPILIGIYMIIKSFIGEFENESSRDWVLYTGIKAVAIPTLILVLMSILKKRYL